MTPAQFERLKDSLRGIQNEVTDEIARASMQHPPLHSHHEAYAVIQEEVDEFWDIVKLKAKLRDPEKTRMELIHVAAMACRTILDLKL